MSRKAETLVPRNGRLVAEDGTTVNQADVLKSVHDSVGNRLKTDAVKAADLNLNGSKSLGVFDVNRVATAHPNRDTLATAGTAQLLAEGAEVATFTAAPKEITFTTDKAVFVAASAADCTAAAGGAAGKRIYVPANTVGWTLPLNWQSVYFVNAVTGELPTVDVIGWV